MRYYQIDGRSLPSVTTILDATMPLEDRSRLELAKAKNPAKFFQAQREGRDRGTYCHAYIATKLQGGRMGHGLYGKWLKRIDPLLLELGQCNPGPIWTEQTVYDLERGYAGMFDLLLHLPGHEGLSLLDVKTTAFKAWPSAIHSAQLQTAAYAAAWNRDHHVLRAQRLATLHLSPYATQLEVVEGDSLTDLTEEFYQRLKLFGSRVTELGA